MKKVLLLFFLHISCLFVASNAFASSRQDSLRGSNGSGRSWWDVQHYALNISMDTATHMISGTNTLLFKVLQSGNDSIQIDLQEELEINHVNWIHEEVITPISFVREGKVYWLKIPSKNLTIGAEQTIEINYSGKPRNAKNPPWDGGFIWTKDSTGKPWVAVACQGLGASSWWPCKDYQGDEPDNGVQFVLNSPLGFYISNGKEFIDTVQVEDPTNGNILTKLVTSPSGNISNPINTYNVTFYAGDYVTWTDTLMGEKGKLDLTFSVLRYHEQIAREHFKVVKQMLHCFEYWMGPYPFYEDGYKLVEAPYLGMEHQSAVAYGNQYKMGYLGSDRSGSGVGLLFDYIIVHESGHEWFGNNITAQDVADNWIHEGMTTYSEALFAEYAFGKEKAFAFTRGEWNNIRNNSNVIGNYGVNDEGSSDKYDKGSAVMHMIRMMMNDDEKFRQLLRGLNKDFYHKIVTSAAVEKYISQFAGIDFSPLFNQYLRTTNIPGLDWYVKHKKLYFRFVDAVDGFTLNIPIQSGKKKAVIQPTTNWQSIPWKRTFDVEFSKDFLLRY